MKQITLTSNKTEINTNAFINCSSLESFYGLDNSSISQSCFQGCSQLKEITVGSLGGEDVFRDCTSLEKFTTYQTSEFDAYVFGNCPNLKEVYLSKTLETVNANAFRGATGLTDVYYEGTQEDWNQIQINKTGNDPLLNARIHFNWNVISECPFDDVREWDNVYYYYPVLWALRHQPQITNGTDATHFSPDTTCTRGQVVTFLWRAMGCPEPKSTANPFRDVTPSDYFYKAVLWANENGITNGTTPTTFGSNDPCTRAHVVTFLWRAHGSPAAGGAKPFVDVPAGQYFTTPVLWAVSKNITNGTSATTFSPDNYCTRGQIVTFLYRDMK